MHPLELGVAANGAITESDQRLIWELVANITPVPDVLKRHGLTVPEFAAKKKDTLWVSAYKEAKAFWESNANVRERIRQKAGMLLEDSLMDILLIVKDPAMGAVHKLEATKQLGVLSGAATMKPATNGEGSGFKLVINVGGNKGVTVEGEVLAQQVIEVDRESVG